MKVYSGKTIEEALASASEEFGVPIENLIYEIEEEKKGLFSKKFLIDVYEMLDIVKFAEDYVLGITDSLGIESSVKTRIDDEMLYITLNSTHNPVLIGKEGRTLQALTELTRLATSNKFKKHFSILIDINGYKNHKYKHLAYEAKKIAHDVQKTKTTYVFAPMPSDERRYIHNALAGMEHIKTESVGEGKDRKLQIIYVD